MVFSNAHQMNLGRSSWETAPFSKYQRLRVSTLFLPPRSTVQRKFSPSLQITSKCLFASLVTDQATTPFLFTPRASLQQDVWNNYQFSEAKSWPAMAV